MPSRPLAPGELKTESQNNQRGNPPGKTNPYHVFPLRPKRLDDGFADANPEDKEKQDSAREHIQERQPGECCPPDPCPRLSLRFVAHAVILDVISDPRQDR